MTLTSMYIYPLKYQLKEQVFHTKKKNLSFIRLKENFLVPKFTRRSEGARQPIIDEKKNCSRLQYIVSFRLQFIGQLLPIIVDTTFPIYYAQSASFLDVSHHSETEN